MISPAANSRDVLACIDFNNYFWTCQAEFNPSDQGKIGIVLGPNDGCVISRSREAKQAGITMGAPFFKIEDRFDEENAAVYSANFPLYKDVSDRAYDVLNLFSPEIERYSIDECFFSLTPGKKSLDNCLRHIREMMQQYTGIENTIAAGRTKVQTKIGLWLGKHSEKAAGVVNLYNSRYYPEALKRTPVDEIWRIGRKSAEKLKSKGIHTAWELHQADHYSIRKLLTVQGARVLMELRGEKCFPLETVEATKHSIGCRRSLAYPVRDFQSVKDVLLNFLALVCARLRKNNLAAKHVSVILGTDPFKPVPKPYYRGFTYKHHYHSTYQQEIQQWALKCLQEIYLEDIEYKKVGIILSGIIPTENLSYRMFDEQEFVKWEQLFRAVDAINDKFGRNTIHLGNIKESGPWQMKQLRRSPHYTTKLSEVPVIN